MLEVAEQCLLSAHSLSSWTWSDSQPFFVYTWMGPLELPCLIPHHVPLDPAGQHLSLPWESPLQELPLFSRRVF